MRHRAYWNDLKNPYTMLDFNLQRLFKLQELRENLVKFCTKYATLAKHFFQLHQLA